MPVRRFFLISLMVFLVVSVLPGGAKSWAQMGAKRHMVLSLPQCIAMAISENEKLKAAGYDVEAAHGQLDEAKIRGRPVLDYEFQLAPVPTDVNVALQSFATGNVTIWAKLRIALGFPIYAFGAMTEARRLAEGGVVAAKYKVVKEREKLIYDIKQVYYGILFGKEMKKLMGKAINSLTNKIENEEASKDPKLSPFDILKMKVFREELIRRLDQAEQEMALAYEGLKIQLGLPPEVKIDLDHDTLEPEIVNLAKMDQYINASMDQRPDSKLIEVGVQTKKRLWTLEKRKLAPQVGAALFLDVARAAGDIRGITSTGDLQNPLNYSRGGIGLQVKGRLDFYGAFGRVKKARAEYIKALYEGQMGKKGIRLDAKKAYEEVRTLHDKVISTRKSQSMSNQMMFLSKSNYELGIGDQDEYAEALQLTLANRGLYFKTVFDYNVALANLEQKVGEDAYARLTGRPHISVYDAFDITEDVNFIEDEEEHREEDNGGAFDEEFEG